MAELLVETPRRSFAFQSINEKVIQDVEGEFSLGLSDSGREYARPKQLEVPVLEAGIIAPTPSAMVYKYSS